MKPNTLPSSEASPPGGALSSTSATPPNATSANTSARGSMYSRNSQAPTGTIRNGASEPISAALATLLCVAPGEEHGEVEAEEDARQPAPGARRARVTRRPVLHSTAFHSTLTVDHPPERDEHARRLGALDERRAERERDDQPDHREHAERLRAGRGPHRANGGIQSPWASSRSSTSARIWSRSSSARGVRVEHRRVVDVLAPAGERGLDGQLLHVDVGLDQRGELRRQRADRLRLDAVPVDEARHLDAAAGRQVVDQHRPVRSGRCRRSARGLPVSMRG